jgi:hypothetical protein
MATLLVTRDINGFGVPLLASFEIACEALCMCRDADGLRPIVSCRKGSDGKWASRLLKVGDEVQAPCILVDLRDSLYKIFDGNLP